MWLSVPGGAVALWAAFPPLGWWGLAWLAPLPWLWWLSQPCIPRRFYWAMYVAGLVYWVPTLQGIRLPHPLLYLGWIALSAYLSLYLVLFTWLARRCLRMGWRVSVAAPMAWASCEWLRGQGPLGFSGALVGHSQLPFVPLIQIADLAGGYLVSALVIGTSATAIAFSRQPRREMKTVLALLAIWSFVLLYGAFRLTTSPRSPIILRAALLQANYDTVFEYNPERNLRMFEDYLRVAERASRECPDLQLVIWPESTFTENNPYLVSRTGPIPPQPPSRDQASWQREFPERQKAFMEKCRYVARSTQSTTQSSNGTWNLVGCEVVEFHATGTDSYNSALLIDPRGELRGRYDKIHLVVFGEYVPFGRWFPWIYRYTPLSTGVTPGKNPVALHVGDAVVVPNICFESTVPHLITWQVRQLRRQGNNPNVIVNITHDGWFWGSSILDLHLACSAFRAVEQRRPVLMAANPGITAWIDGNGKIVRALPRRAETYLRADVVRDNRFSLYSWAGDLIWWVAAVLVAVASSRPIGFLRRKRTATDPIGSGSDS